MRRGTNDAIFPEIGKSECYLCPVLSCFLVKEKMFCSVLDTQRSYLTVRGGFHPRKNSAIEIATVFWEYSQIRKTFSGRGVLNS